MLRKNPLGRDTIDLRQLVIVWRMGNPFEAFSMIALDMAWLAPLPQLRSFDAKHFIAKLTDQ